MSAVVFIPLTQGKVAVVDFVDFEKIRPFKWSLAKRRKNYYVNRRDSGKVVYLHRFLLGASAGLKVDHEDGDGLNNRRCNIRVCTVQQNNQGHRKKSDNKTSQYRGVSWDKKRGKWRATLSTNQTYFNLGRFQNEDAAARAYDQKAKELFSKFVQLNFP